MAGETLLTIVGNLTADPELRYTQSGIAVSNFTIASTSRVWDRSKNEYVDGDALFIRASVWRDFAEHVSSSLSKGSRVIASGRLHLRSWETEGGERRSSLELEVDEIGPSLKFATATVTRSSTRSQNSTTPSDEPWSASAPGATDVWDSAQSYSDETPF